jgi:hypothetical protein
MTSAKDRLSSATTTSGWSMARLRGLLLGLATLAVVGSALVIAIEQHRQTEQIRQESCYARAGALAQVAQAELAKDRSTSADPGIYFLECDKAAGRAA